MILSDRDARGPIFQANLISSRRPYVGTAWHRTTKFCTVDVFLGGQQRLIPRGGAPASPDIWDVLRNPQEYDINQILRDDQTR